MSTFKGLIVAIISFVAFSANASEIKSEQAINFVETSFQGIIDSLDEKSKISTFNWRDFIKKDLLRHTVDGKRIAKYVFSNASDSVKNEDYIYLEEYLKDKVISDYIAAISGFKDFKKVSINIKKVQIKYDVARVYTEIGVSKESTAKVLFRVSKEGNKMMVYDVSISGVSFAKTYRSVINSSIKRKGISYIDGIIKKYKKIEMANKSEP